MSDSYLEFGEIKIEMKDVDSLVKAARDCGLKEILIPVPNSDQKSFLVTGGVTVHLIGTKLLGKAFVSIVSEVESLPKMAVSKTLE